MINGFSDEFRGRHWQGKGEWGVGGGGGGRGAVVIIDKAEY